MNTQACILLYVVVIKLSSSGRPKYKGVLIHHTITLIMLELPCKPRKIRGKNNQGSPNSNHIPTVNETVMVKANLSVKYMV